MENSIEEDIKILEELRIANENCIKNAKNKDNPFVTIWGKQNRALEHILSDYKRVLQENEELEEINNELEAEKNEAIRRYNFETIPIQKVKDKIEELKKKVEELTDDKGYWGGSDLFEQIEVLQELLEKEK